MQIKLPLPVESFLKEHWNVKPLFIPNAFVNLEYLASKEDFFDLAQDEAFETKLIIQSGGDYPWQLKHGPFLTEDFVGKWTLACHGLNYINQDFHELAKAFQFIQKWKFDDIMATISTKDSSVGAHIDNYGVFIIQAQGQRKWQLQSKPKNDYQPDLDIRLLKTFTPDQEFILNSGDALYIPPQVAHHGISLSDSISYSVGFRSFVYKDFINHIASILDTQLDDYDKFDDLNQKSSDHFYQLNQDDLKEITHRTQSLFTPEKIQKYAISFLSAFEKTQAQLDTNHPIHLNPYARFCFTRLENEIMVHINNYSFKATQEELKQLENLFNRSPFEGFHKQDLAIEEELFINLNRQGCFTQFEE